MNSNSKEEGPRSLRELVSEYFSLLDEVNPSLRRFVVRFCEEAGGINSVPFAQMSIIAYFSTNEAQSLGIWEEMGMSHEDTRDALAAIEVPEVRDFLGNDEELSDNFLPAIIAGCLGYQLTQFGLKGHCTPKPVDIDQLKLAMVASLDTDLDVLAGGDSSRLICIAEFLTAVMVRHSKSKFAEDLDPRRALFVQPDGDLTPIEWLIMRSALIGSITFRLADTLQPFAEGVSPVTDRIFLSYSRKDRRRATFFQKLLEGEGFDVWIDEKDIPVGGSIINRIDEGISDECDYFMVLLSKNSLSSNWVSREIQQATLIEDKKDRIFLLPVKIDDSEIPNYLNI